MSNKLFIFCGFVSVGILLYYTIGGGQYSTVFLPVLEGAITAGLIIFWLIYRRVKKTLLNNQVTYLPIIASVCVLALTIVFNIAFNPFGSDRIIYVGETSPLDSLVMPLISVAFFPLGALGIPLGIIISIFWPLISILGAPVVAMGLLVIPVMVSVREIKKLSGFIQAENFRKYTLAYLLCPMLILFLIVPALFTLSNLRTVSALNEENTWQMNHDSYETGKKIQHALEGPMYTNRGGKYPETFPASLDKLVEWKIMSSIPTSPVGDRPYVYTVDSDGKNYTICFPQSDGERCERSWSRE